MNFMDDFGRLVANFSRPGFFRRDTDGNEQGIAGYVVCFSYEARVRGEKETVTCHETAVVLAASQMDAKTAATQPYNDVNIISVSEANPSVNQTLFRISQV